MRRYIWPALFFAASFYLKYYNDSTPDSQLIVPFVEYIFPSTEGDPRAMGAASFKMALGISFLLLASEIVSHIRALRRQRDEAPEED